MTFQGQDRSTAFAGRSDLLSLLLQNGDISQELADQARKRHRRSMGSPIQQVLLEMNEISEEVIYRAVAQANNLEFVVLGTTECSPDAVKAVPVKVVMHYKIMPLEFVEGVLTMCFSNPPAMRDRENLRLVLGMRLKPVISSPADISRAIKKYYGLGAETVMQIREDRGFQDRLEQVVFENQDDLADTEGDASIVNLVNQILLEALEMSATDIHIEPFEDRVQLRYRIDGLLREVPTPQGLRQLHPAIISRMKVMANLNIAEKRLPHDGRIRVKLGKEEFDLRVSIMPTRFGETLNLRILNRSTIFFDLDELGLEPRPLALVNKLLNLPHGIILVTGPTGSGKTTTLYASLEKTNKRERKVITVEDPIEYQLDGISQVQINAPIGLTFGSGLRSILRHDPDIVLVGEIRDAETAEIAIRAALTGHLVLSTLHTNDSIGAVNRLIDMEVEPFLVASSLVASIAQRLVRRICAHCRVVDEDVSEFVKEEIAITLETNPEDIVCYKGAGCIECSQRGYRGRVAIYEFFLMTSEFEDMVSRRASNTELRKEAQKRGMTSLRMDGWAKVARGMTTVEEVTRLTSSVDLTY